jgi:hypothetical protein
MTIGELIEELNKYSPETVVEIECSEKEFNVKEVSLRDYFGIMQTVVIR